ncbi:hypothetical protein [Demequina litorisediminis]|uniref:Threonine aldolase n=1 Tax=Demequina litorisediminis TaxID=1849022 RepID=A0ABQ6IFS4_9MICO|nr:hypothetical protein GCM10025876_17830 [Demequina litorisediminis]
MATYLREELEPLAAGAGLTFTQATEANAVFVEMPRTLAARLRETYRFYDWKPGSTPEATEVRLMCSWDTPVEAVDGLVALVDEAASA